MWMSLSSLLLFPRWTNHCYSRRRPPFLFTSFWLRPGNARHKSSTSSSALAVAQHWRKREPKADACYGFVESEAAADSGAYNTFKKVGGSLRPPQTRQLMQALPLQNFSPDLFPGLVLVLAPGSCPWLFYTINSPNKSEAPTLPGLTQTGEDSASDWSGVVFRTLKVHVTCWCQICPHNHVHGCPLGPSAAPAPHTCQTRLLHVPMCAPVHCLLWFRWVGGCAEASLKRASDAPVHCLLWFR